MVKPETGQANFSEKMMRPAGAWVGEHLALGGLLERRGDAGALAAGAGRGGVGRVEIGQPLGQLQRGLEAVGEAGLDAFADDDAVDHHLDVVLVFLVERGGVLDRRRISPSMRTRVKPAFCHSASSLRYSPLRPRTTGASR